MLKARVITALSLLAVFLPIVFVAPPAWFSVLVAVVVVLGGWEWARLIGLPGVRALLYAGAVLLTLIVWVELPGRDVQRPLLLAATAFWCVAAPLALRRGVHAFSTGMRASLAVIGLVVLPACWFALTQARAQGIAFMLSFLVLVWAADIGAYFAGKAFGRRKLALQISPGKSWEGALGGWALVMALAIAAAATGFMAPTLPGRLLEHHGWAGMLALLTLLVALSVIGDLFESLLKRTAGVKDSSRLLPGHGGVLDRIDALLPVLPLAALMV